MLGFKDAIVGVAKSAVGAAKSAVNAVVDAGTNIVIDWSSVETIQKGIEDKYLLPEIIKLKPDMDGYQARLDAIKSLTGTPARATLRQLHDAILVLVDELSAKKTLNDLTLIIAKQLKKDKDYKATGERLKNSPALTKFLTAMEKIINVKNYQALIKQFEDYQNFSKQTLERQLELCQKNEALAAVIKENQALSVAAIIAELDVAINSLCIELALEDGEKKLIKALFNQLVEKHVPIFNDIRKALMDQLPPVVEKEQARLLQENPDVAALSASSKPVLVKAEEKKQEARKRPTRTKGEVVEADQGDGERQVKKPKVEP